MWYFTFYLKSETDRGFSDRTEYNSVGNSRNTTIDLKPDFLVFTMFIVYNLVHIFGTNANIFHY